MRMSETQKENWRYLIGGVGAVAMLLISVWLKDYVESQKDRNAKIDAIYINSITAGLRDSIQNIAIGSISAHQKVTDQSISDLQKSILEAQIQLNYVRDPQYFSNRNQ